VTAVVMVLVKAVSVDLNEAAVPRELGPCGRRGEVVQDAERWFGAAGVALPNGEAWVCTSVVAKTEGGSSPQSRAT
jgi:hypothetical protein